MCEPFNFVLSKLSLKHVRTQGPVTTENLISIDEDCY